jgi:hypothetical protein
MNYVFNLMDVYVQGSNCEGDGMGINHAKSAGVPVICTDYSAMYEKNRNGGGIPLRVESYYTEPNNETMQWRALFCKKDLAQKWAKLFRDESYRSKLGREARECSVKYYNWDLAAKKWLATILYADIPDTSKTWHKDVELKTYSTDIPDSTLSDQNYLEWCYKNILGRTGVDGDGMKHWGNVLANARSQGQLENVKRELEKHFRSLIDKENKNKQVLQIAKQPELLNSDPVKRIESLIDEDE